MVAGMNGSAMLDRCRSGWSLVSERSDDAAVRMGGGEQLSSTSVQNALQMAGFRTQLDPPSPLVQVLQIPLISSGICCDRGDTLS
jgi:hypothetical protein